MAQAEITSQEAEAILQALSATFPASAPGANSLRTISRAGGSSGPDFEARYKALVDHIPGVIFVAPLDVGDGDAYVSPQIESMLGFTQEEWLGEPLRWYQQVHPEDKLRWSIEAASLFATGQPLSSVYRVLARDGRVVWFQCEARMVHSGPDKPSFIHGIGFDITELKETEESLKRARSELESRVAQRTEELARANAKLLEEIAEHKRTERLLIAAKEAAEQSARVKSEFMANMSHEIRTPMNGVLGLTSLVLGTELTEEQRKQLSMAYSSAESLLTVINEILDFSKLESGKTQLHFADFHLRGGLKRLIDELLVQAQQRGLELSHEISAEIPDLLLGDLGRLRQVLINLIGNAIKFTHEGSVCLKVMPEGTISSKGGDKCMLRFSVIDTGIGIPEPTLKAIFEPFVQADGSITRQYGGTGLGLAISKELVELMGGRIEVTSIAGSGSVFAFTAEFGIAEEGSQTKTAGALEVTRKLPSQQEGRSLEVLVAEDNRVNQMVAMGVLRKRGHTVTIANNGREALEAIDKSRFDIVLMDVQMPVMDGLSATEAIRAEEAKNGRSPIPIIGLSAHALERDRTRCMEAGMNGYVSKPFKANELIGLIEELTA